MRFADLPENEQHDIIVADAKGELLDEMEQFLRSPENLRPWKNALIRAVNRANDEFARRKVDPALADVDYDHWHPRHTSYKRGLEVRLRECKDLIHAESQVSYIATLKEERQQLIEAIRNHRDNFDDDKPSSVDVELWAVLEDFGA